MGKIYIFLITKIFFITTFLISPVVSIKKCSGWTIFCTPSTSEVKIHLQYFTSKEEKNLANNQKFFNFVKI